jgi:hypothetical protein
VGVVGKLANSFEVPIIPNRPLKSADESESFGRMSLRANRENALIENAAFYPELIQYDADYQNNQAVSAAFEAHMKSVLEIIKTGYPQGAKVVEVGCGKGDFLELVQADGWFDISGYDGAYEGDNPAIEKRYLDDSDRISADLVVLRHVLEHIARPQDFLRLLREIFGDAGIYVEVPDFDWIKSNQAFFDVTYEHVNYFTQESLSGLFVSTRDRGLLFGDQYQYVVGDLAKIRHDEFNRAYDREDAWVDLSFDELFPEFRSVVAELEESASGKAIYVWGAATKGVMFCHHLQRMSPTVFGRISAAVDINPMKSNRFMPSVHLPILTVDDFCDQVDSDDLVVIMNPNYRNEIVAELESRGLQTLRYLNV